MAFNKISFVIATVDRDRQLQECVSSIEKAHEYRKDVPVEILVVIQKPRDMKKLALRYPGLTSLYYIDTLGLSHARNFAINKSTGDYFVFLDDEALVNHDFLYVLSRTTATYNTVNAFCGRLLDPVRRTPFSILFHTDTNKKLSRWDFQYFMGSAHVLSREAVNRIGYYDEHFGVGSKFYRGGEETDMFFRLKKANEEVLYIPELVFYHPIIHASASYAHNYGHAFAAVLTKHFICDGRYFFVYLFIGLEVITKACVRLVQKALFKGKYREKDEQYHYSHRLKGFLEGVGCFVSNTYMKRRAA